MVKHPARASAMLEIQLATTAAAFKNAMTEVDQRPTTEVADPALELERRLMLEKTTLVILHTDGQAVRSHHSLLLTIVELCDIVFLVHETVYQGNPQITESVLQMSDGIQVLHNRLMIRANLVITFPR